MNDEDNWIIFFMGFFLGALLFMITLLAYETDTTLYKHGQIDAINGKIMYELKQQPDGTTVWERKQEK